MSSNAMKIEIEIRFTKCCTSSALNDPFWLFQLNTRLLLSRWTPRKLRMYTISVFLALRFSPSVSVLRGDKQWSENRMPLLLKLTGQISKLSAGLKNDKEKTVKSFCTPVFCSNRWKKTRKNRKIKPRQMWDLLHVSEWWVIWFDWFWWKTPVGDAFHWRTPRRRWTPLADQRTTCYIGKTESQKDSDWKS